MIVCVISRSFRYDEIPVSSPAHVLLGNDRTKLIETAMKWTTEAEAKNDGYHYTWSANVPCEEIK